MSIKIREAFKEYDRLRKDKRRDIEDEAIFNEYASELHAFEDVLLLGFFRIHGIPREISERCIQWDWEQQEIEFMIEYLREMTGGYRK